MIFASLLNPWFLLAVPAFFVFFYFLMMAMLMIMLRDAVLHLYGEDDAVKLFQGLLSEGVLDPKWLMNFGFVPLGAYHFNQLTNWTAVVWKRTEERTYLVVGLKNGSFHSFELYSNFETGGLTTGRRAVQMIPVHPSHWVQSFNSNHLPDLWQGHQEGLEYLRRTTGQVPSKLDVNLDEEFRSRIADSIGYATSLRFWYLRLPYWNLIGPFRRHRKALSEQAARHLDVPQ